MSTYTDLLCTYQAAWLADKGRVKVWEKSRRVGASWVEALSSVLEASKKRNEGGQNTYYLSYNKDMTRQFIKDCAWWAKVLEAVIGEIEEVVSDYDKDVTFFRITFASGTEILALPSEPRSLRSKQGRVIIDEAAFVDDLEELLKAALALLMWGGQVLVLSTHNGIENKFNELVNEIRAGEKPYSLHRTDLDSALAGGLYKAICRKSGQEWTQAGQDAWRNETIQEYGSGADEELFCIPARSGGVWLTATLIESCMSKNIPVLSWSPELARASLDALKSSLGRFADLPEWEKGRDFVDVPIDVAESLVDLWCREHVDLELAKVSSEERHYLGVDFGRKGDLSVFWVLAEQQDLSVKTLFVLELRDTPFRAQWQFLKYIVSGLSHFSGLALDARGIGMQLAEFARQEWGAELAAEVMLTEGWYREHMPRLKSNLEDRSISLPMSADIKTDLRSLRVVNGVPRVPESRTGGKGNQRHGDSSIALALALFAKATMCAGEEFELVRGVPLKTGKMFVGY